jgi:hypothetical protein
VHKVLAVLVICSAVPSGALTASSRSTDQDLDIEASVDVSGQPEFTGGLGLQPGPDGKVVIHWEPAYQVSNRGNGQFYLQDLTLDFVSGTDGRTGKTIDLVKAGPMHAVKIYSFNRRDQSESAVGGGERSTQVGAGSDTLPTAGRDAPPHGRWGSAPAPRHQVCELPWSILSAAQAQGWRYRCAVDRRLDLTVTTDRGTVTRPVEQALMPDGCVLLLPPP